MSVNTFDPNFHWKMLFTTKFNVNFDDSNLKNFRWDFCCKNKKKNRWSDWYKILSCGKKKKMRVYTLNDVSYIYE